MFCEKNIYEKNSHGARRHCIQALFIFRISATFETMKTWLTVAFVFFVGTMSAQTPATDPEYTRLVDTAFAFLQKDSCRPCLAFYEKAFQRSRHSALSHLRAALCANQCKDSMKAENLGTEAVVISWAISEKVLDEPQNYPEFQRIAGTSFETGIRSKIRLGAERLGINLSLRAELKKIHEDDQEYRRISNPHPPGSPEYHAYIEASVRADSLNLAKIEQILQKYGYPGKSLVGEVEASTTWLVIQHAPLEKQVQYFPMIEEAAQKGEIRRSDWALLLDRIRMRQGQPQVYGSQIVRDPNNGQWMLHPVEDEANVNKRRAEVGLGPLEDYALRFGIVWKPK